MLPLLRREACLPLALVFAGACSSEPRVPTTITLTPAAVSFTALGQTQQLSPSVSDQQGDPLTGAGVSWSTSDGAVAAVSATGLVTGVGPGSAQVTAASGSANATVAVSVVQTPTQLTKVSGDGQTATAGAPLGSPLVVEVSDALGNPVAGTTVKFAPAGGGNVTPASATTGADGRAFTILTTGTVAGTPQAVTASIPASAISVSFSATTTAGPPASISLAAGNNQSAPAGQQVAVRPAVVVRDANANPVAGVAVEFEVVSGGGSISGGVTVTNASGRAEVGSWTLGSDGPNMLHATAAGSGISGNPVTFSASTAANAFNIEVRFLSTATSAQAQAFAEAEQKWESLVVGDLANWPINIPAGSCDDGTPALDETIDDVIIFATIAPIDGAGGILGQAGPCYARDPTLLPLVGVMFFDSEDLEFIENEGLLERLILHEMAHVLGFGTLWPFLGLLADPVSSGGTDPHFIGSEAIAAFDDAGGSTYAGAKVPVEDTGAEGTYDSHWRESVFGNELMTGFIDVGANPLSAISVAALADQGYTIDLSAADAYSLTAALRVPGGRKSLALPNDLRRIPLKVLNHKGRLLRMLQR